MGARQTKFEGTYLPVTPVATQLRPLQAFYRSEQTAQSDSDPRSPSGPRTPIHLPPQRVCTSAQLVHVEVDKYKSESEKPFDVLRKRILKGFGNNDPRSPSLNRTPLVFDDSQDRTLDLDDTFADLFIESNGMDALVKQESAQDDAEMPDCSTQNKGDSKLQIESPLPQQQKFDPRSPSIGVERTPIILCDDDNDVNEDVFLENILSTLTLNINASADSSFVSLKSAAAGDETIAAMGENIVVSKPTNKHLDRVRIAKKTIAKGQHRRQKRNIRQKIYEDCENQLPLSPQIKSAKIENTNSPKGARTPLSCMRNRSHLRSRSVESSARSTKAHFSLKSFDDTLNPSENKNIPNIRIMRDGSEESLKL